MNSFRKLPTVIYYIILVALLLYGISFIQGLGREATKEYKMIKHPINSEIRQSNSGHSSIHLSHSVNTEGLLKYYEEELKRNGWVYLSKGTREEIVSRNGATGRIIHYFVFAKDDLKLAISFIPNSYNQVIDYNLDIAMKELAHEPPKP